jgi:hypothetical protein
MTAEPRVWYAMICVANSRDLAGRAAQQTPPLEARVRAWGGQA